MEKKPKEHKRVAWNTMQPKEIRWLWHGLIPLGKLSLMVGDAGLGKTTLALDIAARLTTGRPMPLSDAEPIMGNVLFQSAEDDISDTLLPRCISAGADLQKIESIEADGLNIDDDCDIIEIHIKESNARLVLLDPLQSFMGRNADMCRITDVRRLLTNLGAVAARNDCAVIIIAHQNKAQGTNELHRVFGSVDITATARIVPVSPQLWSATGLTDLLKTIFKVKKKINPRIEIAGILLTICDERTKLFKEAKSLLDEHYGDKVKIFNTHIPNTVKVGEANYFSKCVMDYDVNSKAALAYKAFATEVASHGKVS